MGFLPNMYFVHPEVTNLLDAVDSSFVHLPHHSKPNKLSKDLTAFVSCSFALLIPTYPNCPSSWHLGQIDKAFWRLQVCTAKNVTNVVHLVSYPSRKGSRYFSLVQFGSVRFGPIWLGLVLWISFSQLSYKLLIYNIWAPHYFALQETTIKLFIFVDIIILL